MTWWHRVAYGTVPVVGVFVCVLLFQLGAVVTQSGHDESVIAYKVETALDTINAKCGVNAHCGTLAEMDKTLTHTSDLVVQSQLLVRHTDQLTQTESKMLPEWNQKVTQTMNGVNYAVGEFGTSTRRITDATLPILNDTDVTVRHTDGLVTSPYVLASLKNFESTSTSLASSAQHADATLGDVQVEADRFKEQKKLGFWARLAALF